MDPADYTFVREFVRSRSGIAIDEDKDYLIKASLDPLVTQGNYSSVDALIDRLRTEEDEELSDSVLESLTNNETSFFRDFHPFNALQSAVLPELIQNRQGDRKLRILSAGCSTGQEVYSIAMVLDEHFPQLQSWDVEIIGYDLDRVALAKARKGSYAQLEVQRGLPAVKLLRYFKQIGLEFEIADQLQSAVGFNRVNLVEPWPSTAPFDIIFLRNTLVYFDLELKKKALSFAHQNLASDGYLFLGIENGSELDNSFERHTIGRTSVYRLRS